MEIELILSFLTASVLLALMPGPDNIFVLTESLTKGQKNGVAISFGLGIGVLVHTLAAATGLSIIIQQSAIAFTVIKYLGAIYLFYLAFQATKENNVTIDFNSSETTVKKGVLPLLKKGFLMNVLNPKVSLFFIAFLPQFISPNGINVTVQMIILGLIFMTQAIIVFSSIAMLAGKLTKYVNSQAFWKITKWSKIVVLTVLGITLALSEK
ncbi:LysE family translocator [Brumimicrobium aurantiacum]|uniref:LysE family translocator n=1 Tax=Brumimicrobium aurantiacum TaxID=1737063 RepID=A0A3E1F013_9FLAO|nr:LysE family translocator [Brumimicrobium aurantiacum]RFC55138.1 LysE family translocator [Brumimicrobium aurantiacum]